MLIAVRRENMEMPVAKADMLDYVSFGSGQVRGAMYIRCVHTKAGTATQ